MVVASANLLTIVGICIATTGIYAENVAWKKPCKMSDQSPPRERKYPCSNGNDGDTNQDLTQGSCFLSNKNEKNFWRVDLQGTYEISKIWIYNRLDTGSKRSKHLRVYVGIQNADGTEDEKSKIKVAQFDDVIDDVEIITVPEGTKAGYVKIIQNSKVAGEEMILNLCEIKVFTP